MDRGLYKMGCRLPVTTYYRTMSIDNKPTTIIIGPSEYLHCTFFLAFFTAAAGKIKYGKRS